MNDISGRTFHRGKFYGVRIIFEAPHKEGKEIASAFRYVLGNFCSETPKCKKADKGGLKRKVFS